ncbi:MAG: hypothetical protein FJZ67_09065 [Bacteroidetes bacterium]|nr:hypothetical protein [Bacteroidota bacterium]
MKKHIIIFTFNLFILNTYSQQAIETEIYKDDFRFGGSMSNEQFELLKVDEQRAYLLGLKALGIQKDSVNWIDDEFIKKLVSDDYSFSQKNVWVDTKEFKPEIEIIKTGKDFLTQPKVMMFFKRKENVSSYTFQVYY